MGKALGKEKHPSAPLPPPDNGGGDSGGGYVPPPEPPFIPGDSGGDSNYPFVPGVVPFDPDPQLIPELTPVTPAMASPSTAQLAVKGPSYAWWAGVSEDNIPWVKKTAKETNGKKGAGFFAWLTSLMDAVEERVRQF